MEKELSHFNENGEVILPFIVEIPCDTDVQFIDLSPGDYTFTILDSNGCQITHNFEVDSIQESCLGFIPTIFTPNGPGANATWVIPDLIFYPDATVQIYNRWGQLVFECKNNCYFNVWDGTNDDGENLPFGNYYFLINYKENEKPIYGAVTIKR